MQTHRSVNIWSADSPKIRMFYHKSTVPVLTHNHDFSELIFFVRGTGIHNVNGTDYPLVGGCASWVDPFVPHAISFEGELEYFDILLGEPMLKQIGFSSIGAAMEIAEPEDGSEKASASPMIYLFESDSTEILSLVRLVYGELNKKRPRYLEVVTDLLRVILTRLSRVGNVPVPRMMIRNPEALMQDALDYIISHVHEEISLREVAEKYFYNPSYFSRFFKQHYGMNYTDFVRRQRIRNSLELLKDTTMSVEKIAQTVGYSSKSQFYRMFRKETGSTITEYMERREKIRIAHWKQ